MNKFDKITNKKATRITLLVILLLLVIIVTHAQTGYLVVVKDAFKVNVVKTQSLDSVQVIAAKLHIDAKAALSDNNYFEFKNDWDYLYVERKRIVKGKYRKLKRER